jgi:hypothetical protein
MPDEPRPAATSGDTEFSLSIEEVAERYAAAGHPRTLRTLQRYCASGHLDCRKAATALGDKYFVTPQSVARHVAQIAELAALQYGATGRDTPRPDADQFSLEVVSDQARQDAAGRGQPLDPNSSHLAEVVDHQGRHDPPLASDLPRPVATEHMPLSPLVAYRDAEVGRLHDGIDFLRGQIATKDEQIAALLERDKETNFLVRGLQQMLTPLLGNPQAKRPEQGSGTY